MANSIVTVLVQQQLAPAPNKLQKKGALLSQGATNTDPGTISLLTQPSDLTPLLNGAIALTSLSWAATSGGTATGSTASAHDIVVGQEFTISGVAPAGYNGSFVAIAGTAGNVLKYALASNPGAVTTLGSVVQTSVAELVSMVTTFFGQGSQQAVWVLELGPGTSAQGVSYLDTWITANPGIFYSDLVPRAWADEPTFLTFLAQFEAPTAKTYFYVTMTDANYTNFTPLMKCVKGMIESPDAPSTEFSHAADFQHDLNYNPSSTNKVTPNAFCYLFGVTAFPTAGNSALLAAYKAAGVNVVGTGAEGGLTNTILFWGTTMDGRDFAYWYSVDWVQINAQQAIAADIINGSNDPVNPLYYNQQGINRLQGVVAGVMSSAITFGMVVGSVVQTALDASPFQIAIDNGAFDGLAVVNAIPFIAYLTANPDDFAIGEYNGLAVVFSQQRGFKTITINLVVSDFVVQ